MTDKENADGLFETIVKAAVVTFFLTAGAL
jgi:hypothetical protein